MGYPNVLISEGSLLPALNPLVEVVPEGLKFSWGRRDLALAKKRFRPGDAAVGATLRDRRESG